MCITKLGWCRYESRICVYFCDDFLWVWGRFHEDKSVSWVCIDKVRGDSMARIRRIPLRNGC
jgi:hypothetical protein